LATEKKIGIKQIQTVSEKTDKFLGDAVDRNQTRMLNAIRSLENKMLASLRRIELDRSGRIEGVKVNLKNTQQIHKQMLKDFETTYGTEARALVSSFDRTSQFIEQSWAYLGETANYTDVDKDMMKGLKASTTAQFQQFGTQAQKDIQEALYTHMVGGRDFSSLLTAVSGALSGHVDARGRSMAMYAKQYAFDATMNYHNQVNVSKAEGLGIYHYLYVGDIIGSSRPFCRRRAGKVYTRGQINSWDRYQWAGKAGPAFIYRGGYNCRHHWRPIRPEWLDGSNQVDIADWNVGQGIEAKPTFLRKTDGTRGWNEFTKDERKILSNVHRRSKQGAKFTENQKGVKFWYKGLNQAEREMFIEAFEKEGIDVPDVLKKKSVKPKSLKPDPVKPTPPIIKPKPEPPKPSPSPKPVQPSGGRSWEQFSKEEKKKINGIRRTMIKGHPFKDGIPRVKWWRSLDQVDRDFVIARWEAEGIIVDPVIKQGSSLPLIKPNKITPLPKVEPPTPSKSKIVKPKGSVSSLENEYLAAKKSYTEADGWVEKSKAYDKMAEARAKYAPYAPDEVHRTLRKEVIKEMGTYLDDREVNRIYRHTRHVGFEVLSELKQSGMSIRVAKKGRASFGPDDRSLNWFHQNPYGESNFGARVIAHETSHAIDSYMSNTGRSVSWDMGTWRDTNPWAGESDAKNYRKWFKQSTTGKYGTYGNGDGRYHVGNFIDEYEGRIYKKPQSNHPEFFSMGSQRYGEAFEASMNELESQVQWGTASTQFKDNLRFIKDNASGAIGATKRKVEGITARLKAQVNSARVALGKMDIEQYLDEYLDNIPLHGVRGNQMATREWGQQKKFYPEYAEWMKNFYKKTRSTRGLTLRDIGVKDFKLSSDRKKALEEMIKLGEESGL
jgi:hypothetical protein